MGYLLDGLDAESYDRSYADRELLQRILAYFRPQLWPMVTVVTMVVGNALLGVALPLFIARGIDSLAGAGRPQDITLLVIAILVSGMLSWVFNYVRQVYSARVIANSVLRLQQDAFDALISQDMAFYDRHPAGKLISRVTSDTQEFATVITLTLELVSQLLLIICITAVLFAINTQLALLALAVAPLIVILALGFRRVARHLTRQVQRALAKVNANVQESMSGIAIAKSFRQERSLYDSFQQANGQLYAVNLRGALLFSGIFPVLFTITGIGTTIVVYAGGAHVLGGAISAGNWFLFVEALNIFWLPLTSIASFWSQFQLGLAASERVFALIDADQQVVQTDRQVPERLRGQIEFCNIDFCYNDREQVLQQFNLMIAPGETLALVGHTGAGKSSLGKLIARFYEFQAGQLLIDGHDVRSFDLHAYRSQLSVVPQVPFLFAGSVAENIRYAQPTASDEEVLAATRRVARGDWLLALPDGLQTQVGEMGKNLSSGQRQLVALARLLVQDPMIVILDEATASVDPLTESLIQEGLEAALYGRTAIVIAHRLSTVKRADRIVVLDQGKVIEQGNHKALIQHGGHYAALYETYFRHQAPETGRAVLHTLSAGL